MSKGKDYLKKIKSNTNNNNNEDGISKDGTNPRKGASYWLNKSLTLEERQNIEPVATTRTTKRKKGKYDYLIATKEDEVKDSLMESKQNVTVQEILSAKESELSERELIHKNDNLSAINRFKIKDEHSESTPSKVEQMNKFERLKENPTNEDTVRRQRKEQEELGKLQKFKEYQDTTTEQIKVNYETEPEPQNNNTTYTQNEEDMYLSNTGYEDNKETDMETRGMADNTNPPEMLDKMKNFKTENTFNNSNPALTESIINRNVKERNSLLLVNKTVDKKNKGITGGIGSNKESNENIVNLLGIVSEDDKKQGDTSVPTRVTLRSNMEYTLAYVPKSISSIIPEIVQVTVEDEMKLSGESYLVVRKPRIENEVE